MNIKDTLAATVERSVAIAGSGSQKDILGMLQIFKDKLLSSLSEDDVPGVTAPTYIVRGNQQLGAGVVLALQDRVILGWTKGLFRKPTLIELPRATITQVEPGTKPKTGRMTKPLASLKLTGSEAWELLFTQDAPDLALRDTLAQLLSGALTLEQMPEGAKRP